MNDRRKGQEVVQQDRKRGQEDRRTRRTEQKDRTGQKEDGTANQNSRIGQKYCLNRNTF